MAASISNADRFSELLAARALEGLADAEQAELEELTARFPGADLDAFERVAACLAVAGLRVEPMPAALRARVEADARAWLADRRVDERTVAQDRE